VENGIGMTYGLGFAASAPTFFSRWVRPGMTVYDVGANKGQMMMLFASLVGPTGRVVSFEPSPAEHDSLNRNVELNGLGGTVRTVRAAIADSCGELRFTYAPSRPTEGKLIDVELTYLNEGTEEFTVPAVTLDAFIEEEHPPQFIKLDVEGAAAAVIRGAQRVLRESAPVVYIELHGPEEQAGVRDGLLPLGYSAETLDGQRVPDPTAGWFSPLICTRGG